MKAAQEKRTGDKIPGSEEVEIVLKGIVNRGLWFRTSIGDGTLGKRKFDTALNIDGKALIVNSEGLSVTFHIPWEEMVRKSIEAIEKVEKVERKK